MLTKQELVESPADAALHVFGYFYLADSPSESDARAWRRASCAAVRIHESTPLLCADLPAAERRKHAKRVRRAAREIVRLATESFEVLPDMSIAAALGIVEGYAQQVLDTLPADPRRPTLH